MSTKAEKEKAAKAKAAAEAKAKAAKEDPYAKYGTQMALVNSNSELKELFKTAAAGGWTAQKFQAEFQNTDWYKKHSVSWRGAETAKRTDPGQWAAAVEKVKGQIVASASKMGFSLGDADVAKLAEQTLYTSWGEAINMGTINAHVVEMGKITGTGGTAVDTMNQLKQQAFDNGQTYSDDWYAAAARGVLGEGKNLNMYQQQITNDAKSMYGTLTTQLDAGMTVRQAAAGYINTLAGRLGMQATDVKLDDPLLTRALKNSAPDGKPAAMPLYEFEKAVKSDDRYFKTNEAHQNMESLATEIARQFGKAS